MLDPTLFFEKSAENYSMNTRQQLYKKNRLSGMSAYQSAVRAGYSHYTAISAHRAIESRIDFDSLLVKHGLDDETLLQKLNEGLDAKRLVAADVIVRQENGELVATKNENNWVEYDDAQTRHKYIETALKLRGRLKPETGVSVSIAVVLSESLKEARSRLSSYGTTTQKKISSE